MVLLLLMMILSCLMMVKAEISYSDVYTSAVSNACDRHYEKLNNGALDPNYCSIGYALSDITGDGICELVIQQMVGKHWKEYWIYGIKPVCYS